VAALQIGERPLLGRDVFPASGPEPAPASDAEREIEVGIFELVEAFRRALRAAGPSGAPHEIEVETVTVRDRMLAVMRALEARETLDFDGVLALDPGGRPSRAVVVATFLAILELARLAALRLYQGLDARSVPSGPIHLRRTGEPGDESWTTRIAELM
jgi:segregation and condensation protein A